MMMKKICFIAGAGSLLAGCSALEYPVPHQTTLADNHILTTSSAQGQVYVLRRHGRHFLCSNSRPDSSFDQEEGADITVALVDASTEGGGQGEGSEEVEMSGRTPAVLMSRELFFRACEFSWNYDLTSEQAMALYSKTLDGVLRVWTVEAGNTKVTIGDTLTASSATNVTATAGAPSAPQSTGTAGAASVKSTAKSEDDDDGY